jgi:hypothetical protein
MASIGWHHRLYRFYSDCATIESLHCSMELVWFDGIDMITCYHGAHMRICSMCDIDFICARDAVRSLEVIGRALRIYRVHESFRMIGVAYPPTIEHAWLSAEIITMFHFIHLQPLQASQRVWHDIDFTCAVEFPPLTLLDITETNAARAVSVPWQIKQPRSTADDRQCNAATATSSSTRRPRATPSHGSRFGPPWHIVAPVYSSLQTLGVRYDARVEANMSASQTLLLSLTNHQLFIENSTYPDEQPQRMIERLCCCLPTASQQVITEAMEMDKRRITTTLPGSAARSKARLQIQQTQCSQTGQQMLQIGHVKAPINTPKVPALVPHVAFHDMPTHVAMLQELLQDYVVGGRLALLSNAHIESLVLLTP